MNFHKIHHKIKNGFITYNFYKINIPSDSTTVKFQFSNNKINTMQFNINDIYCKPLL